MLAEAWLAGPEGGPRTALQILSQAPQGEPCVLWTKAFVEKALGLTEPAFITLRHLQGLCPRWPGLMPALQQAAAAAAAAAANHDTKSTGCSLGGSSTRGTSNWQGDSEGQTGRGFQGGGHSSTSSTSSGDKLSINEAFSLMGLSAGTARHGLNKADLGRAFRRQAAVLHPDSGAARAASALESREAGGTASAELFIRLREAYELLNERLG
ncbi:hypothetical protein DUNSADRAFT_902 [Dunaliella salina]|uniref:J domain-containing protein n=1 Tax=Dunaliella salina TaxID=3046 RepID=A0ABQ7H8P0_DUNSA|nr:hypothetical protein DUNSADRAFT_902 [Dunaliella salina]|eukprot:KAF5843226.1 hypothetical protein DUNSADRAFT_902 [Dunaliella salina]